MDVSASSRTGGAFRRYAWPLVWLGLIVAILLWRRFGPEGNWETVYPDNWILPLDAWINDAFDWLVNRLSFGLFTFRDLTRAMSWLLEQPLNFALNLLAQGFGGGLDSGVPPTVPPLSWLAIIVALAMVAHRLGGTKLAILGSMSVLYLAFFGQWGGAMVTLSSVLVSVPIGILGGLMLGILAARSSGFRNVLFPVLDLMQTVPVFAYLVPLLVLFGFGPVTALIATIIYAMPPMVRITVMALEQVPHDVIEFGRMVGCTRRQMTWKIMVPAASKGIMVGVNQVIMMSLNMVIIASMIGAGGLGFDVLSALRNLNIGKGVEAGLAITLLAVTLDRMSQAVVSRPQATPLRPRQRMSAKRFWQMVLLVLIFGTALGEVVPALATVPKTWTVTTAPYWDHAVTWINIHFYNTLETVKALLLLNVMIPFKRFLISLPWLGVVALVALAGYRLRGGRLAIAVAAMAVFIAATGNWEKAMVSVYLTGTSVVIASMLGIPIGVWAARNNTARHIVGPVIDTLQTLPSFVYLIPVVMLFHVGDFSAMIAIVAYAIVPAIRYTEHGIRKVPQPLKEAAIVSGCTRGQLLWKVQLPLALPEILLGINQTVMMALSMLVITALVGTSDLGQQVYIALTNANTGQGVIAGICVAFIAMIVDRLVVASSDVLRARVGSSVGEHQLEAAVR